MRFFIALQFLTILPSPFKRDFEQGELGRARAYFPLIGLMLGIALAALDFLLRQVLPVNVVSVLLVATLAVVTGGIHLDGLIDSCDGLFVSRSATDRLAIMRDSRVGSFGVIGAVSLLLLKYTALASLSGSTRTFAIVLAPVLSRWAMVLALNAFPYARSLGKGTPFFDGSRWPLATASLFAVACATASRPFAGVALLLAVAFWTLLSGRFISARLGGLTGDSYGAINETAEVIVLVGALLTVPVT